MWEAHTSALSNSLINLPLHSLMSDHVTDYDRGDPDKVWSSKKTFYISNFHAEEENPRNVLFDITITVMKIVV